VGRGRKHELRTVHAAGQGRIRLREIPRASALLPFRRPSRLRASPGKEEGRASGGGCRPPQRKINQLRLGLIPKLGPTHAPRDPAASMVDAASLFLHYAGDEYDVLRVFDAYDGDADGCLDVADFRRLLFDVGFLENKKRKANNRDHDDKDEDEDEDGRFLSPQAVVEGDVDDDDDDDDDATRTTCLRSLSPPVVEEDAEDDEDDEATAAFLRSQFAVADADGDGVVSFDEFAAYVRCIAGAGVAEDEEMEGEEEEGGAGVVEEEEDGDEGDASGGGEDEGRGGRGRGRGGGKEGTLFTTAPPHPSPSAAAAPATPTPPVAPATPATTPAIPATRATSAAKRRAEERTRRAKQLAEENKAMRERLLRARAPGATTRADLVRGGKALSPQAEALRRERARQREEDARSRLERIASANARQRAALAGLALFTTSFCSQDTFP
jgi:Ca2+-binding EF-hand superfamily protein